MVALTGHKRKEMKPIAPSSSLRAVQPPPVNPDADLSGRAKVPKVAAEVPKVAAEVPLSKTEQAYRTYRDATESHLTVVMHYLEDRNGLDVEMLHILGNPALTSMDALTHLKKILEGATKELKDMSRLAEEQKTLEAMRLTRETERLAAERDMSRLQSEMTDLRAKEAAVDTKMATIDSFVMSKTTKMKTVETAARSVALTHRFDTFLTEWITLEEKVAQSVAQSVAP